MAKLASPTHPNTIKEYFNQIWSRLKFDFINKLENILKLWKINAYCFRATRLRGCNEKDLRIVLFYKKQFTFFHSTYGTYITDGNLELGAHVRSNLRYLICSRHLNWSRAFTNRIFLLEKNNWSSCVPNMCWVTIYHKYHDSVLTHFALSNEPFHWI